MLETLERAKTYLSFTKEEFLDLIIAIGAISFMFYFGKQGKIDLFSALLIVALSLFFHIAVQKIFALKIGFKADFKIWWYGILISLMFIFVTRGAFWWLIFPGGLSFFLMGKLRVGAFRYGYNYKAMGAIGLSGPIASIVLATIFKNIEIFFLAAPNPLFHNIFIFNLAYAVSSMLPIPPLDGHFMFYASRTWYTLLFTTIVFYTLLAALGGVYSWIIAIFLGLVSLTVYFFTVEF